MTYINNDHPYCKSCGACGEEGCCPPTQCTMDGDFCKSYLRDLKFEYSFGNEVYSLVEQEGTPELKKKMRDLFDNLFDKHYK